MGRHGFFHPPPIDEDRRPIDRATVRRVIAAFRPYRGKVGLVALAIVITSGLGVVNPLLIKWIFDNGLFGNPPGSCGGAPCPDLGTVYLGVILMIAIPIVTGIIGVGQTYLANLVGLRVMQDFRNGLYEHLQ
ncbi:MAG: ABC transporter ATP-binding protein, partial [Actinomycetota bacterium]|nr:ABC transporter ATP-binding protein [Actinomycetota bacterium]